jgi:hypothetical protein
MWIFTKHGFLSIVQHNTMPGHFQVKARIIDPLEILWPEHNIEIIGWADYRFRITLEKEQVTSILNQEIQAVGYTSFKDECRDNHDYHDALVKVWSTMYNYQLRMERR